MVCSQEYQRFVADGQYLEGSITILKQTSVMVNCFADHRPILGPDDSRLGELRAVAQWFIACEEAVKKSNLSKKESLMSRETRDDTMSLLLGFDEFIQNHFNESKVSIVPA